MARALVFFVVVVVVVGLAGCASAPVVPAGDARLRVMSFNLNYGLSGDEDTLAAIDACDCDLIALQEVTPAWRRAIEARYSKRYPQMRFETSEGPGGLAILSRLRIVAHELLREVTWFPAQRVVVESALGDVQVLNVHLRPPFDDDGSVVKGVFVTPTMRRREIEWFAAQLAPGATIVAGDFNESSGGALDHLDDKGFADALVLADGQRTWHWPTPVVELSDRLDHVLYSRDLLVAMDARVVERGGSDHFPVLATFARRAPPPPQRESWGGSALSSR